jgi:hypothetical protein
MSRAECALAPTSPHAIHAIADSAIHPPLAGWIGKPCKWDHL